MTSHLQTTVLYSAVVDPGTQPTARIFAGDREVVSFPLFAQEDVKRFVDFLNENRIEPVHVKDCLRDALFDHFADAVSPD